MKTFILCLVLCWPLAAQTDSHNLEIKRWREQALNIKIIRDNWGIAHIYGKTDADAVFGMLYAQCEDDFPRVERNYLTATARLAEALGEEYIYHDLRTRLFQDSLMAIEVYKASPDWLKKLCNAFADGVNYYLYVHPEVKPLLINRFQPWMPFLFSEGSIGGDIESISLSGLKEFYGHEKSTTNENNRGGDGPDEEPRGSNGFAIAPSRTANHNAMLLINPHTTFYFRSEIHVNSEEGLNSYGAVTWGQFFIYQGFNERCGWMHTSSAADVIDEYAENVELNANEFSYHYGGQLKKGSTRTTIIRYKSDGQIKTKEFKTYFTHHGPVVAKRGENWITVRLMQEPLKALTQSYTRIKAKSFSDFEKSMALRTNSSNNTVYADGDGTIAYWHGNFMPRRNPKFDWSKPVDGSNPETDWKGLHPMSEMIAIKNPTTGWIQNCNSTPFTASGLASPKQERYPIYMAPDDENPRGLHAVRVLQDSTNFTLDKLISTAYDSYLTAFEILVPTLLKAYKGLAEESPLRIKLKEPIQILEKWNYRFSNLSVETTIAVYWATALRMQVAVKIPTGVGQLGLVNFLATKTTDEEKLKGLVSAIDELQADFVTWKKPWGEVNRFQRLTGNIEPEFDDNQPSLPVPFTSSFWGSLASFGARRYPNTKKMYGNSGNSFVAVVEFGNKVTAGSVVTGGSSGYPPSINFSDQADLYVNGKFKNVLFYYDDVMQNSFKIYFPGE